MGASLLQIPHNKATFHGLIVVDTVLMPRKWPANTSTFPKQTICRQTALTAVIKKPCRLYKQGEEMTPEGPRAYQSNNHFSHRPPSLSFPPLSLFYLIGEERRSDDRARRDGRTTDRLWQKKTEKGRGSVRQSRLTESMSRVTGPTGFLIAFRAYFSSKALVIGHERRW